MAADRVSALSTTAIMDLTPVRRTGSGAHVMRLKTHAEFTIPTSRLLDGYDFISGDPGVPGFKTANDGNGRDLDASDPGDFITVGEAGVSPFQSCTEAMESSWHGSHVASIIAANGNNGIGIAGVNWNARLLPVRVLGKCGGYSSDTNDGLRWAAGLAIPGIASNQTPAHVINLSLGGPGACSIEEQSAIDAALQAGVRAIVVAAGNDAGAATQVAPGNCRSVITVTGIDRNGSRAAGYANIGPNVAIAAPGGWFTSGADAVNGILSLSNTGATIPIADALAYGAGTSQAAAHVSGVVSLMLAVNSTLSPYQVYWVLRQSARAFPNATCTTATCGAGILDAAAAVSAAATPVPDPASGGNSFTSAPAAGSATTIGSNSANRGGESGSGGGGGCAMRIGGQSDPVLALLAMLALFCVLRGRGVDLLSSARLGVGRTACSEKTKHEQDHLRAARDRTRCGGGLYTP